MWASVRQIMAIAMTRYKDGYRMEYILLTAGCNFDGNCLEGVL